MTSYGSKIGKTILLILAIISFLLKFSLAGLSPQMISAILILIVMIWGLID